MNHTPLRASAAATANGNTADFVNNQPQGLGQFIIDVTAVSGTTPVLTIFIEGQDPASQKYFPLIQSAAINATGTTVLNVAPGITAVANSYIGTFVPLVYRVRWTITGTTPSFTFSIGANLG